MEFFPEMHIDDVQADLIARGLMGVAKADGKVLEREAAMINMFAESHSLEKAAPLEAAVLAQGLSRHDLQTLFLKSCFLVAYADGACAASERKVIEGYADAIKVARADLDKLETSVKEHLLRQLAHVQDSQAVVEVAKGLKL